MNTDNRPHMLFVDYTYWLPYEGVRQGTDSTRFPTRQDAEVAAEEVVTEGFWANHNLFVAPGAIYGCRVELA